MAKTPYDIDLDRNPANFQPLTPLQFLERAAAVLSRTTSRSSTASSGAIIANSMRARAGSPRRSQSAASSAATPSRWCSPIRRRCWRRITGCRWRARVLNTINTRLDAAVNAFTLDHADAKVLIVDREFSKVMKDALAQRQGEAAGDRLRRSGIFRRRRAHRRDRIRGFPERGRSGFRLADAGRRMGRDLAQLHLGHHRRSQGRGLSPSRRVSARARQHLTCGMGKHPVYLWTLPMFHCNGWCFPWSISVVAGTHVCLR